MVKVSTLQTATSFPSLQGFQKSLYAKLKKAKTHDIILSSLGGFAAVLYLDTYYGPQAIHRSLDRVRVYWLNKKINLDKMNKEEQDKAIDEAIASCAFVEHLSAYFKPPSPPLKQTEKEELEELYEYFQKALDEKGWHPEGSFFTKALYEKYFENQGKTLKESIPDSIEKAFHFFMALLSNYWCLLIVKAPQLVKFTASHTKNALKESLLHPIKTSASIYAYQNLFATTYEILTKLELMDKHSSWSKKIEKLMKNLSSDSEIFFLRKNREVHYAMFHLLVPFLFIYAFQSSQDSLDIAGKNRLDKIKRQPFSFNGSKHHLQCLDEESKKKLQTFFQSKSSIARLSGAFSDLLMGIIQDFEHYKEIESFMEKRIGFRFFYLAADSLQSLNSKKAYLKKLKHEIAITDRKQQIVLVIDPTCWSHLKEGDFFKDFLKGIGDRKLKILLVGDDKEADMSTLPSSYSDDVQAIAFNPSIGKLLKDYFEDHPLASIVPEYRSERVLEDLFLDILDKMNDQDKSEKGIEGLLKGLHIAVKRYEKETIEQLNNKFLKQVQSHTQKINGIQKCQKITILRRFKVKDFSKLDEEEQQLKHRKIQGEHKLLDLIIKRLKNKR